jgi:hypothetical protein
MVSELEMLRNKVNELNKLCMTAKTHKELCELQHLRNLVEKRFFEVLDAQPMKKHKMPKRCSGTMRLEECGFP